MENQLHGQEGNIESPKNRVMMEIIKRGQEQAKEGRGVTIQVSQLNGKQKRQSNEIIE